LDAIQAELLERAETFQTSHIHNITSREQFVAAVKDDVGFFRLPWGGDDADEVAIKDETKATLRCYPMVQDSVEGLTCPLTGKPAREWALFARAY
jgi:prolyl-tRNA synthetase